METTDGGQVSGKCHLRTVPPWRLRRAIHVDHQVPINAGGDPWEIDNLPDARWQRCMVHFYRNVFSHVPSTKVREVAHMLKAVHAQESRPAAQKKAEAMIAELRHQRMTGAAELAANSIGETLTFCAVPDKHWIKIRMNNPLERIMKKIQRRTIVVGAFFDGRVCLNFAAARLRHIAGTQWSTRRCMNMDPLYAGHNSMTGAVA